MNKEIELRRVNPNADVRARIAAVCAAVLVGFVGQAATLRFGFHLPTIESRDFRFNRICSDTLMVASPLVPSLITYALIAFCLRRRKTFRRTFAVATVLILLFTTLIGIDYAIDNNYFSFTPPHK